MTATHPMLDSYYSQDLVFFSILVAVLASYTALAMTRSYGDFWCTEG
ncbi:MHYT domain-containing protein [Aeromonas media]|nr:MHYT domain-containing protein [Aeromonas media]